MRSREIDVGSVTPWPQVILRPDNSHIPLCLSHNANNSSMVIWFSVGTRFRQFDRFAPRLNLGLDFIHSFRDAIFFFLLTGSFHDFLLYLFETHFPRGDFLYISTTLFLHVLHSGRSPLTCLLSTWYSEDGLVFLHLVQRFFIWTPSQKAAEMSASQSRQLCNQREIC